MLRNFAGWLAISAFAATVPLTATAQSQIHQGTVKIAEQMAVYAPPRLTAQSVLVLNGTTGEPIYQKRIDQQQPIASISKLMTAMVLLDSGASLEQPISISDEEVDRVKHTTSRLAVGTTLSRKEMLLLALMSSENRAAHALARTALPGGMPEFVARMNQKAHSLGMTHTIFHDPTGLDNRNVSDARDLARMVKAAESYPLIREFTTTAHHDVYTASNRLLQYKNSNALVRQGDWDIALQKTGYIQEAGHCMVMQTTIGSQPLIIVILSAGGGNARVNDARVIKSWLESHPSSWLTAG
jgi:D-alanyl-D-alanine endopeptidase (penicillin-binding protein 7)